MTGSAGTPHPDCQDRHRDSTLTRLQSPDQEGRQNPERRSPGAGGSPRAGDDPACPETGGYREIMCPRPSAPKGQCVLTVEFAIGCLTVPESSSSGRDVAPGALNSTSAPTWP